MVEVIEGKTAYLFPGQGSQKVGMGLDLYAQSPVATELFDRADSLLGYKLSEICFHGPQEELTKTVHAQPAIYVTSLAAFYTLRDAGLPDPDLVAGHSVGELSALTAAGAMSFESGLQLVVRRAEEMQRVASQSPGTMAAVLGLGRNIVEAVCHEVGEAKSGIVDCANFNATGQVVISGDRGGVEAAAVLLRDRGAKRVMMLEVSGGFHSRLMTPAADAFCDAVQDCEFHHAAIPTIANVTADYESDAAEIARNLVAQIDHSVRWEETMQRMASDDCRIFVEVGAGTVLGGLVKRAVSGAAIFSVGDFAGLQAYRDSRNHEIEPCC